MINRDNVWSIYATPLAVILVSIAGLVSALLGDQWWDYLAWIGLGLPLVVGLRKLLA